MGIYFKATRDILGIYLREQGVSTSKGNFDKQIKGTVEFINRERGKKFKFKRRREHATPSSPPPTPPPFPDRESS